MDKICNMLEKIWVILLVSIILCCLSGCSQVNAKYFGGTTTIELEPNTKLEEITWKDENDLWYLTRPMTEDDVAETHTFKQSRGYFSGMAEGEVIIIESKTED